MALVIWGAALGTGAGLGLFAQPERAEAAALAEVETDWTVTEGEIAITVQQMGSSVKGTFADWTASISYDETAESDTKGQAEVTISIPSLTLGTVTDQAKGPDFLAAATHPEAVYTATLHRLESGYEARGTLDLRGITAPLTLPFTLAIDGDTAQMTGTATLDRRAHEVGGSVGDAATLGFDVALDVALTARRAP